MSTLARPWPRLIALVDMNCFFAAIEQLDNPAWRGKPVGVTNGQQGTCLITCSYEARALGVKTGMRLREARRLCPELIQAPARSSRYAQLSSRIMTALLELTPDREIFSVDEVFLDFTACQTLYHYAPQQIAERIRATVERASGGLHCAIGIAGDKTTAKWAAKRHKRE